MADALPFSLWQEKYYDFDTHTRREAEIQSYAQAS